VKALSFSFSYISASSCLWFTQLR